MTGVMASTEPKIAPLRSASPSRGRSSRVPFVRAAAKASADRLSARTRMATRLILGESAPGREAARSPDPGRNGVRRVLVSRSRTSMLPFVPRARREYVDTSPLVTCGRYSPTGNDIAGAARRVEWSRRSRRAPEISRARRSELLHNESLRAPRGGAQSREVADGEDHVKRSMAASPGADRVPGSGVRGGFIRGPGNAADG